MVKGILGYDLHLRIQSRRSGLPSLSVRSFKVRSERDYRPGTTRDVLSHPEGILVSFLGSR